MSTKRTEMTAPTNVDKAARMAEAACMILGVETLSIHVIRGRLFGVGTYGNSYFVDDEDGKLHLYTYVEEG